MRQAKPRFYVSLNRIITLCCIMLVPVIQYGIRVLFLCGTAAAVSMLTELLCLYIRKKPFHLEHLEAAACGLLLALMFPVTVPYSVVIIACIFAIIIGRQIFGGGENLLFPTASVGYVFSLLTWHDAVLRVPADAGILPSGSCADVLLTDSASHLWNVSGTILGKPDTWVLIGERLPMGSCNLLLLCVVLFALVCTRSVSLPTVAGVLISSAALWTATIYYAYVVDAFFYVCMTNMTLFAAIYLFGDPLTAPKGLFGLVYGLLAGCFSYYLAGVLHIENAPVILSVLMQPLALWMHTLSEKLKQSKAEEQAV